MINSSLPVHCIGVDLNRNFDSVEWGKFSFYGIHLELRIPKSNKTSATRQIKISQIVYNVTSVYIHIWILYTTVTAQMHQNSIFLGQLTINNLLIDCVIFSYGKRKMFK